MGAKEPREEERKGEWKEGEDSAMRAPDIHDSKHHLTFIQGNFSRQPVFSARIE